MSTEQTTADQLKERELKADLAEITREDPVPEERHALHEWGGRGDHPRDDPVLDLDQAERLVLARVLGARERGYVSRRAGEHLLHGTAGPRGMLGPEIVVSDMMP